MEAAYLQKDSAAVDAQIAWGRTHDSPRLLLVETQMAIAEGRMQDGLQLLSQMKLAFERQGLDSLGGDYYQMFSQEFAQYGMTEEARRIFAASSGTTGNAEYLIALAETGSAAEAHTLLQQELKDHPDSTLWKNYHAPAIQAAIFLAQHKPREAVDALNAATEFEEITPDIWFLRGQALLADNKPTLAVTEFRKVITRQTISTFSSEYPLAHLGLGRAYAKEGKPSNALEQYQELFGLWKKADANLPVLQQAKHEAAELTSSR